MARRNGIAGQLPFGAPVARDAACGIGGMLPFNAPGIGGCRSVGIGAHKTGVSNLALSTRRQARGTLGRVSAGGGAQAGPIGGYFACMKRLKAEGHCMVHGTYDLQDCRDACKRLAGWYSWGKPSGAPPPAGPGRLSAGRGARGRRALTYKGAGIGKSYASRLLGNGVTVDVTRTGNGSYSATITTSGKSMANKVLGNKIQMNGGRHENGYHGSVGVGAKPTAHMSPARPPGRHPKADMWPVPSHPHPHADMSPVPPRRPAPGVKRGRRGRALTLKAGR